MNDFQHVKFPNNVEYYIYKNMMLQRGAIFVPSGILPSRATNYVRIWQEGSIYMFSLITLMDYIKETTDETDI